MVPLPPNTWKFTLLKHLNPSTSQHRNSFKMVRGWGSRRCGENLKADLVRVRHPAYRGELVASQKGVVVLGALRPVVQYRIHWQEMTSPGRRHRHGELLRGNRKALYISAALSKPDSSDSRRQPSPLQTQLLIGCLPRRAPAVQGCWDL